jgi:chitinase
MIKKSILKRCLTASMSFVLATGMLIAPTTNVLNVSASNSAIEYVKNHNNLRNVMYYGDWSIWGGQGNFMPSGIPADQLTHINFAFLDFDADGTLKFTDKDAAVGAPVGMPGVQWGAANAGILSALQDVRKANPNLRLGVSLGGWSKSADFSDMAANPTARANFVSNVMKFIKYTNMDFVDLDWEYPNSVRIGDAVDNTQDEGTPHAKPADKQNYITLLQDLRDALDDQGDDLDRYYELSVALPASINTLELGVDVDALFDVVDFANMMTYDLHGAWDTTSGHHTSLYTNPADPNADLGLSVNDSVNYLLSEGAPANKIVIGAAFYSRGWEKVENDFEDANGNKILPNLPGLFGTALAENRDADASPTRGADNEAPIKLGEGGRAGGVWGYGAMDKLYAAYPGLQYYWDDAAKAPYLYNESTGAFFTFENKDSVEAKAEYVLDKGLGGMISWMQSNDKVTTVPGRRDELTKAIKEALFGSADLQAYHVSAPELDVDVAVTTYSDSIGNGYEFAITNNEAITEAGEVLSMTETAFEAVKSPKLYIKTKSGVTFSSGGYGAGTVTNADGYGIADLTSVYDNQLLEPGEVTTFKLAVNGAVTLDDITSIELSQRIIPTGAEIGKQSLQFTVSGDVSNPGGGTDPGTGGDDPGTGGDDPGTGGGDPGTAPAYDINTAYNAGAEVTYNGNVYRAKWWTQGNIPGAEEWGPWELVI